MEDGSLGRDTRYDLLDSQRQRHDIVLVLLFPGTTTPAALCFLSHPYGLYTVTGLAAEG